MIDEDDDLSTVNGENDDRSETGTDNDINDEDNGTPGTTDNQADEDSYDPAEVTVGQVFDVALKKTYAGYTDVNEDGILNFGEDVIFDVEVINQGTITANNVIVTDYYPTQTTLSAADDNGWTDAGTYGTIGVTSIAP